MFRTKGVNMQGITIHSLSLFLASLFVLVLAENNEVTIKYEWKNLQFEFENPAQKEYAIAKGYYNDAGMKRPYDVDIYIDDYGRKTYFLSIPRVTPNIPFTLGQINESSDTPNGPNLKPFPSMEWHLNRTCDKIFSVFRLRIDQRCKRLWVIDTGRDTTPVQICPPKIVVFDLKTNRLVFKHEISSENYTPGVSVFNSLTLMPNRLCGRGMAFLPNARGISNLLVFDEVTRKTWTVNSELFKADPTYYPTTIAGETFNFIDGLYTVAISPFTKKLYGHPFAALYEFEVPLQVVTNKLLWSYNATWPQKLFKRIGERPTQSATEAIDSRGNIWFTQMNPLAILCWNPINPYSTEYFKIVTVNNEVLQFVAGMKVYRDPKTKNEYLLMVSNRLQKHNTGTVNPNEINYRVFRLDIGHIDCVSS